MCFTIRLRIETVGDVADYLNDFSFVVLPQKQRLEVAWRYLQFGLIHCPRSDCTEHIPGADPGTFKVHI